MHLDACPWNLNCLCSREQWYSARVIMPDHSCTEGNGRRGREKERESDRGREGERNIQKERERGKYRHTIRGINRPPYIVLLNYRWRQ